MDVSRIVDTHVHWWDPFGAWMQMASPELAAELRMGDIGPMLAKDYTPQDYVEDVAGYPVSKAVWVMATLDPTQHLAEVEYAQSVAAGHPLFAAMIGSVDPSLPITERSASFDRQAEFPEFRGIRIIGGLPYGSPVADDVLTMLAEGGHVYEDMGGHESMADGARYAERHPEVPWIVEHMAWPREYDDPGYLAAWREGIRTIASVDTAYCKLSGFAMVTHDFDADRQRPIFDFCLEQFGIDRVLYGSNFPVDRNYGTFAQSMSMFDQLAAGWSPDDRERFFHANAERVYRI